MITRWNTAIYNPFISPSSARFRSTGLEALAREYAERLIFPEDRDTYCRLMDFSSIENKLRDAGRTNISRYLRTRVRHGQYAWKQYILLRIQPGVYLELIRTVHSDLLRFMKNHRLTHQASMEESIDAPDAIDDFSSINRQYGFDFGDKAIAALGRALKKTFGLTCAVGRYTGHQFVVLHQIHNREEAGQLRTRIKKFAADIRQIEGIALTLYLSVGYCVYSECEDLETQPQKAEIRLLADHDDHSTMENRVNRASEIFHLYDDLPVPYCVCRVVADEDRCVRDGIIFYVNHAFERLCAMDTAQLLGRRVSQLFPKPDSAWYDIARRAALEDETVAQRMRFWNTGREYHVTASPVIHPGYCGFTVQDLEAL